MKSIYFRSVVPPMGRAGRTRKTALRKLLICVCSLGIFFTSSLKAQLDFVGGEVQVNTTSTYTQEYPSLSMDGSGNAIVVWQSWANDGNGYGIFGQRMDNAGAAIGGEFQVNTTTAGNQEAADVAVAVNGEFVVTWMSQGQDGDGWGVYAQCYNSSGLAQGSEIQVASVATGDQKNSRVAIADNGSFVVVWVDESLDGSEQGVFARRFDANGTALGSAFQVNTYTTNYQGYPVIAMAANGSFVAAWQSFGQDGDQFGVYFQRYDATGNPVGVETAGANETIGNQQSPSLGLDALGNMVLAWSSYGQDGDHRGVFARRFDANGNPVANEFQVNSTSAGGQDQPAVMVAGDGNFAISWSSYGQDGSFHGVFVQQFSPTGAALGLEKQVNTRTADFQQASAAAWPDTSLNLLIVWMDGLEASTSTHDGDEYGIYLQGLSASTTPVVVNAVCQDVTIYLDVNGVALLSAEDVDGGSTASAGTLILSIDQSSFGCAVGQSTVELTASAGPGNSDVCTANVTVLDAISPGVNCPADLVVGTDPGMCAAVVFYPPPIVTDNCISNTAGPLLTTGLGSGAIFPVGTTIETWTVSDASGNAGICSFSVTVNDTEAPGIVCPADMVVPVWPGYCVGMAIYDAPIVGDNCSSSGPTFVGGVSSGQFLPPGTYPTSWAATDQAGNTSDCSFNITVIDNQAPSIVCPGPILVQAPFGWPGTYVNYNPPFVSDPCGANTFLASGPFFPGGTTYVTWGAMDSYGNVSYCSFPITVTTNFWWGWGSVRPETNTLDAGPASPFSKEEAHSEEVLPRETEELDIMAYPNPFEDQTTIRFRVPVTTVVTLEIYSMYGQRVATLFHGEVTEGVAREVEFRPEGIASGIYHYRLTSESGIVQTGKLMYGR